MDDDKDHHNKKSNEIEISFDMEDNLRKRKLNFTLWPMPSIIATTLVEYSY